MNKEIIKTRKNGKGKERKQKGENLGTKCWERR
jgi:hypothetical protein